VAFYNPVWNESCWKPLFGCLCGTDFKLRKTALEDITTILHDNIENCRTLQNAPLSSSTVWQDWVFNVMTDIPKTKKHEDETVRTAFAYCVNVLTMVHYEEFLQADGEAWLKLMTSSFAALHSFAGATAEGAQVGSILLGSLVSKLASNKKMFAVSDYNSREWGNLRQLQKIARHFVFKTAFWNKDFVLAGEEEENKELSPKLLQPVPSVVRESVQPKFRRQVEGKEFVLSRQRNKINKTWDLKTEIVEQKDFGIHWSDDGICIDIIVCEKILALFRALSVHEFDPAMKPNMQEQEKKFFKRCASDFVFWEDAKKLLESIKLSDIEETRQTTHRRVSHWVRDFLDKMHKKSDRKALVREIARALGRTVEI